MVDIREGPASDQQVIVTAPLLRPVAAMTEIETALEIWDERVVDCSDKEDGMAAVWLMSLKLL